MLTIPLNTHICLKAHTGKYLQNESFWASGRCNTKNTGAREQMILLKTNDNKIIIQSRWDNKNLQVQYSGQCVFTTHNQEWWEKFEVESDEDGKVYFINCRTGRYMQCDKNGFVVCIHKKRAGWEAWTIVDPQTSENFISARMTISQRLRTIPLNAHMSEAHTGNNLQNEFFWGNGRCQNANTEAWEHLMLIETDDNKIIIQSRWDNKNLQVQDSGQCAFANHNQELWEKFDVESDEDGTVYFINCRTGRYMQCGGDGLMFDVSIKNEQDGKLGELLTKKTLTC
jgi:hypothetical protein